MPLTLLLCLGLFSATPTGLEPARQAHLHAQQALALAHAEVAASEARLSAITEQIALEKAGHANAPALFVPGGLENKLAESQRLSDALARARDQEAARQQELAQARAALYGALSQELAVRASQARDSQAIAALKALEAERAAVAPAPPAAGPSPSFQGGTDDPRELHERADALRDQADKLARQASALDARIESARQQQKLERQLRRLSGSEGLFDEGDRRLRVSHRESPALGADRSTAPPQGTGSVPSGSPTVTASSRPAPVDPSGLPSVGLSPNPTGSGNAVTGTSPGTSAPAPRTDSPAPSVSAPAPDLVPRRAGEVVRPDALETRPEDPAGDEDSLEALLRARSQLLQRRQALDAQAQQLDAQSAGQGRVK